MVRTIYILVTFCSLIYANRLPLKIYEIRKTRDEDSRVDLQYYDPDFERISLPNKYNKRNLNDLANYIMQSLQNVPQNEDENKNVKENGVFIEQTRSLPLVIVPNKRIVYREKPRNYRMLHELLHSALRTNVIIPNAEDRTAAPRHRGNYDNDYK